VKAFLFDAGALETCEPVTCNRSLAACPVGNRPLVDQQREWLRLAGFEMADGAGGPAVLYMRGDAWLSGELLKRLRRAEAPVAARDAQGDALAWIGGETCPDDAKGLAVFPDSFAIRYPWDLLKVNELLLAEIRESRIEGELSPAATVAGTLLLGRGSRILPGVYIEGTVVIGENCKIGPNCYLRGHTSIGDGCHIGQGVEIKNSILMAGVSIGHLSYCGDSIVGAKTNFGAGTITANFRHDGQDHRSRVGPVLVGTGRRKLGAIIGDGVHTGIHTSIYPGRKLWPNACTLPGAVVKDDVRA
jgi:bifunctional UDP-N-acetylglucosamine pyrophosphorylase/glucosamine-1-phosphate N-acetyltransferase